MSWTSFQHLIVVCSIITVVITVYRAVKEIIDWLLKNREQRRAIPETYDRLVNSLYTGVPMPHHQLESPSINEAAPEELDAEGGIPLVNLSAGATYQSTTQDH